MKSKKFCGKLLEEGSEVDEDEDDDDEGGLIFGDMDFDVFEGDSEEEDFDVVIEDLEDEGGVNVNEVYYKDFFVLF